MFSTSQSHGLPPVDMHIHTVHCGHAAPDMTLQNIVRRAEQMGLQQIAIAEHVWIYNRLSKLDPLLAEFERLKSPIKVRLGVEVDVDPCYNDGRLSEPIPSNFRPLVVSTHAFPGSLLMWYEDSRVSRRTRRRLLKNWFVWVTAAVNRNNADVLAHPGVLISREGPEVRFEGELLDRFSDLFAVMRDRGVAFELNEHVKRKFLSPEQRNSYYKLPALAVELGVKLSIGSDSHKLEQIGDYEWLSGIARQAGVKPSDFSIYDGPGLVKGPLADMEMNIISSGV